MCLLLSKLYQTLAKVSVLGLGSDDNCIMCSSCLVIIIISWRLGPSRLHVIDCIFEMKIKSSFLVKNLSFLT